jgi:predicted dehydrogenase
MTVDARAGPSRLALIGAGQRGTEVYGAIAARDPGAARFVAVAEPDAARRDAFGTAHGIAEADRFADWPELIGHVDVEGYVIATPDRMHAEPALAAARTGRPVLLEKPIVPSADELDRIQRGAATLGGPITVAHPLRYTPFFGTLAAMVRAGEIGRLRAIDHLENVGFWHFAHSYVRGNWRRADLASPLILAKACHDLDVLRWLVDAPCTSVASSGELSHFTASEAPPGAPARCLDGCPHAETCPFFAPRAYLSRLPEGGWPVSVVSKSTSPTDVLEALRTGPYGRCVYHCDNDVPDHQATLLTFANGVVATLTVAAFSADNTRTLKLFGTRGEIRGHMDRGEIEVRTFRADAREPWDRRIVHVPSSDGHAIGDQRMFEAWVASVAAWGSGAVASSPTSLAVSLESHRMAFAAETARRSATVVALG